MRVRSLASVLLVALLWMVIGCGGGGGGSSTGGNGSSAGTTGDPVTVRVDVRWGQRLRTLEAPTSADWAMITLKNAGPGGADLEISASRPSATPFEPVTYFSLQPGTPGEYDLSARFFAGTSDSKLVATAAARVRILSNGSLARPDGKPLGPIASTGEIASITVVPSQVVELNRPTLLQAEVRNKLGEVVAVHPGAISWGMPEPSHIAILQSDGTLTAYQPGTVRVTATVEGVTSPLAEVTMRAAYWRSYPLIAHSLAWDAGRSLVLASVTDSNQVLGINPATGVAVRSVNPGSAPTKIAITSDNAYLYVILRGSRTIRRIHLGDMRNDLEIQLTPDASEEPLAIATVPGKPNLVVVSSHEVSGFEGHVRVYDNGVALPQTYTGFNVPTTLDSSENGAEVVGLDNRISNMPIFRFAVGANGLTLLEMKEHLLGYNTPQIAYAGGRIYTSSLVIFGVDPIRQVATLPGSPALGWIEPDVAANRLYVLSGTFGQSFHVYRLNGLTRLETPALEGLPAGHSLLKIGEDDFVFATDQQLYFIDNLPMPQ